MNLEQNIPIVTSEDAASSLTQIFCALPKSLCDVGDYGFGMSNVEGGGHVLSIVDIDPKDVSKIRNFLQGALDEETEGYIFREDEMGMHIKFDHAGVLMELLTSFVESGNHGLSDDEVKWINKGIDNIILRESGAMPSSLDMEQYPEGALTPREMICDVFNDLLETAGLRNHEAYFHEMEDDFFEISIDGDGNSHPKFVEFCNELAECCEHENVSPNISGDCNQLILDAEDEMAMVQVLKAYFQDCCLYTAEDMYADCIVKAEEVVLKDGLKHMEMVDPGKLINDYPMISRVSSDRFTMAYVFDLKANETTSINLDAIETAILQEQKNYKAMKERHRRFIVH